MELTFEKTGKQVFDTTGLTFELKRDQTDKKNKALNLISVTSDFELLADMMVGMTPEIVFIQ